MDEFAFEDALIALRRAALEDVIANEYSGSSDPHADATAEYATERLSLAARALVRVVEQLPYSARPVGWDDGKSDGGEVDRG